jgi:hypothetical protein
MLEEVILRINNLFINEAINSPTLTKDMAAMEKYIAESYSERAFIELLQNADDAYSTSIKLFNRNGNIYFANNGRNFNEQDILSICRSGASNKQRSKSIGYRGVGFKSTSYLGSEIVIHSNDTYFMFSKLLTAKRLNIDPAEVPTIRIPFLLLPNEIEYEIKETIESLKDQGYNTIFVFKNARTDLISEEINMLNDGYFLFLNHVVSAEIALNGFQKKFNCVIEGEGQKMKTIISENNISRWYIINDNNKKVSIAFKVNEENKIVKCNDNEAVFHCYLPTLEKTGYPFKINGNFSTDPSRKHLILDFDTEKVIESAAFLLFSIILEILNDNSCADKYELIELINYRTSFSKFALIFSEKLNRLLNNKAWLKLNSGQLIKPSDYKKAPKFLEKSEFNIIREKSNYVRNESLALNIYKQVPKIEDFLENLSSKEYDLNDWIKILEEEQFVREISEFLLGKIYGNLLKQLKVKSMMTAEYYDLSNCFIKKGSSIVKIFDQYKEAFFSDDFKKGFIEVASQSDAEWFDKIYKTDFISIFNMSNKVFESIKNQTFSIESFLKKHDDSTFREIKIYSQGSGESFGFQQRRIFQKSLITKWRAAEQQCVEIERILGNEAKDVSRQNLGYDVESVTPDGRIRYIEVKSVSKPHEPFSMTNNEYSAAHQYGKSYYLCVLTQCEDKLIATYINDPINNLKLEKRIRQWEWACEEYEGEQYIVDLS